MATYSSILTKTEDAFKVAFETIAGADLISGVTIYKQGDQTEIVPPFLLIEAVASEPLYPSAPTSVAGEGHSVTVQVTAAAHGEDSTRTALGNLAGLVEAVMVRSADQMLTQLSAAAVTDYTPKHYRFSGMSSGMFDDSIRTITHTAVIGGISR